MQTKVVLALSALLIIVGAASFYLLEYDQAFASLSTKDKVCASLFQSVTTRTAGFNSCNIAGLSSASVFIMIIFMFIGGSPGSTAGGVKTTTVAVLWAILTSGFRRREDIECYGRKIPYEVIQKAISVFVMSLLVVIVFLIMMLMAEKKFFVDILFETVSAFGTVGLSTGITPELSERGKLIITLLMFIGRLGPLTIGFAFMKYRKPVRYEYAEERLMIG
jgi:trk system potassium uptake protein TrkH